VDSLPLGLMIALALLAGVLAQVLARHLRVPGIVPLLVAGAALGPDGLGWIEPSRLGRALFQIVDLGVALILFEGGLNLELARLRREPAPLRRLVTLGALVTLVGGAAAALVWLDWPLALAVLFGSLVVVTGPTVVGPIVRELRLRPRVGGLLEAEGVLIDPIGAILAAIVLGVVLAPGTQALASGALGLALRLGFGVLAGALAGGAIALALRLPGLVPAGLGNLVVLAAVLALFEGSNALVSETGILAVTVAGITVRALQTPIERDLREFKDQLSLLAIGLLFVLLAADVRLAEVASLGAGGAAVVATLVLVVRPLGAWLCTLRSELSAADRAFVAWVAPRGIVAAAVASLAASLLESHGTAGGRELRALVFATIAVTVVLAGLTAGPLAALLDLRLPARRGVAILGANGLGVALASELARDGVAVVLLDSNPQQCRRAEERGLAVVYGNALEERSLQRARLELVGTVIGATTNATLNALFVERARAEFRVPRALVALDPREQGVTPDVLARREVGVLFDGPHDLEWWDECDRRGRLAIERFEFAEDETQTRATGTAGPGPGGEELFVPLVLRRGAATEPMHAALRARRGDVLAVALWSAEAGRAREELAKLGFRQPPAAPDARAST
jgi:NhaP-type Na+/H+ or K+/H+ antiporter